MLIREAPAFFGEVEAFTSGFLWQAVIEVPRPRCESSYLPATLAQGSFKVCSELSHVSRVEPFRLLEQNIHRAVG
jgi:hypothetical protein